jgi:hypothetical protein
MAHPPETIQAVRTAFVFDQLSLEVAAIKGGVSPDTARRWKREAKTAGDDWDKARAAQLLSGGGIEEVVRQTLQAVVTQVQATLEALELDTDVSALEKAKALASLADSYHKLIATARRLMPETDVLAVETTSIKGFVTLLIRLSPDSAEAAVTAMEAYANGER